MTALGNRLKDFRNEKGLTQPQVADAIQVPRATYANWEQGRREPDVNGIILLCKFYNVSADELIGLKEV